MGSATRTALEAAKQDLAARKGVTLTSGEQLLSAGRAIESSAQLRAVLADPAVEASEKSALIASIFGALDATASSLLAALASSRWSNRAEFLDGVEEIGIRAIAHAAGAKVSVERELFEVERAVSSDAELELAIGSTLGDTTQKATLVDRLLGASVSPATAAIVRHLVQSPRGRRIGELLRSAADLVADANGRLVATVTSAAPLSAAHEKKLVQTLTARYHREPILNVVIDDRVLGGLRVQVGDEVVDGTIASRLADLRLQLAG
ncbi:F0F1 ATP synthase subunit delta [uncultured Schumannella sp.]|uniref:F0F1 ATP synthase subunit delta n=1 Tax=uncultured Schumannella sp. TaxID=1195956 RepID=UPI0025CD06D1|nr:F0F1 ATP synthase subunit delta [uncultured Schumannella sp.]